MCSSHPCADRRLARVVLTALWVSVAAPESRAGPSPEPEGGSSSFFRRQRFIRGDGSGDGKVDLTDPITLLGAFFLGAPRAPCDDAADANADLILDVADPVFLLNHLFLGGAAPPGTGGCGIAPGTLGCAEGGCPDDDFPLIAHVLDRITFGATEELYATIQTRDDLIRYIEEQLDGVPDDYSMEAHEPELHARVESLGIGFPTDVGPTQQLARLEGSIILEASSSRWQLLQVLARFWENHFHTQIDALVENFFQSGPAGGNVSPSTPEIFAAADAYPAEGRLTDAEWNSFRQVHPRVIPWDTFPGSSRDNGAITLEEFLSQKYIATWKYARRGDQTAVAADMERREHEVLRKLSLGRFRDLVDASAKSVAMLIYLNGFENTQRAPNENFAREVLELFTVGVDTVYTQRDIEELSRVFTGWSVEWVARAGYEPNDINFDRRPASKVVPIDSREPAPYFFPSGEFWDDREHTWAFVIRKGAHDWKRKDLFLRRFGGVDSLGNPLPASAAISLPENESDRGVAEALAEYDLFLEGLLSFRDVAKFISTKLIQLFVTDDLSLLARTRELPSDLREAFDAVDRDRSGAIDAAEWEEPVPLALPGGRPADVFYRLDADGDGRITAREYGEPDLLQACIETWSRTDGDIREVVRTILLSDEFLSLEFRRAKVKTPLEVVTSAMRALGGAPTNAQLLATAGDLDLAGMDLFEFADPTGESELGVDWMHTTGLLERLKYLNRAANPERSQESRLAWSPEDFETRYRLDSPGRSVEFFAALLLAGDVLPEHRLLALETHLRATRSKSRALVGFLLSLPQFQKQ